MHAHSRFRTAIVLGLAVAAACATTDAPRKEAGQERVDLGLDLLVRQLTDDVWLHVSAKEMPPWGKVPSNGLVVLGPEGAVLVDTPWTPEQTALLVDWVQRSLGHALADVVVTHSHEDRTGGVAALPAGTRIHALPATAERSAGEDRPFALQPLPSDGIAQLAAGRVDTFFPGAGHAPDNLVVWLPEHRLLFGGCFVKDGRARDLGNVADADVRSWGPAVQRVLERFPGVAVVVPGHGQPGGPELLSHTAALIEAASR